MPVCPKTIRALILGLLLLLAAPAIVRAEKTVADPEVVKSPLKDADAAVGAMYVTHPYETTSPKVIAGQDIAQITAEKITQFAQQKKTRGHTRELWMTRYHLGDPRVIEALIKAKKAGVEIRLLLDLNDAMDVSFKEDEKSHSDFRRARPKDSALGRALQELRDAGFKYRQEILSQPFYKKTEKSRNPLMHQKEMLLVERKGEEVVDIRAIRAYGGTGNLSVHLDDQGAPQITRYNRELEVVDRDAALYELEHMQRMEAAFKAGLPIKSIVPMPPRRVMYENGEYMDIAFSDGKVNPNNRIADVMKLASLDPVAVSADPELVAQYLRGLKLLNVEPAMKGEEVVVNPNRVKIKHVTFSHFVLTHAGIRDSLVAAMKKDKSTTVLGIFDDRFVDLKGWGLAPNLDGFDVLSPYGRLFFGVGNDIEKRTDLYIYQRGVPGSPEVDEEGPPVQRHVWHDKTTILEIEIDGKPKVLVFTGSFNASNNYRSAERQVMMVLEPDSPLVSMFKESIEKPIRNQPQYALPFPRAVFRNVVGLLTGHTDLEVPMDLAQRLADKAYQKDLEGFKQELEALADQPSNLAKRPKREVVHERIEALAAFLKWHAKEMPQVYKESAVVALRRVLMAFSLLGYKDIRPTNVYRILESLFWDPRNPDEALKQRRIFHAAELLGLKDGIEKPQPRLVKDEVEEEGAVPAAPCKRGARKLAAKKKVAAG